MNISTHELKQIQLYRQHLTARADKLTVVRDLCGLQAQFLQNALHSLKIRCTDFDEDTVGDGLVKNWTIRGTVHVFAEDDLPLFIHCNNGDDYLRNDWRGYRFWNSRGSWALTPERQEYFSSIIISALEASPLTRDELKGLCRSRGMTEAEEESMFCSWGGGMRELCERGFVNYKVDEKKTFALAPKFTPLPEEEANLEIARRYLTHIAPATLRDICYYFKCSQKQAKVWLSRLEAKTLTVNENEYYCLGDISGNIPEIPRCIFLAGFDQLMLAYEKKDSIYLPKEHLRDIFNLAGIVMPSVLLNGTVCGRWKKTKDRLDIFPFRKLSKKEKTDIESEARKLWNENIRAVDFN